MSTGQMLRSLVWADEASTSGTVTGMIVPADIFGPETQGLAAGEFRDAVVAVLAGVNFMNVHTTLHPAGAIRGKIK